ncbi:MAG: putative metalloprotease CJM1_0395 family protein [Methylobacter sp.]|nr:putative metalloprotease CJM1_0395 family protein [Methylobacter sp.]
MISSVSSNSPAAWQTDYSQKPPVASTNNSNQDVQKDPALKTDDSKSTGDKKTGELSESDLKVVSELKQRDAEVKAHEAAHLAAAGGIATGGASFEYQQGPDGIQYAIGGEVSIDTSPVAGDPAATLRKADTIRRAALSPAQPSGPDMQVAASATAMAAQAQAELLQKNQDSQNGNKNQLGTKIDLSA